MKDCDGVIERLILNFLKEKFEKTNSENEKIEIQKSVLNFPNLTFQEIEKLVEDIPESEFDEALENLRRDFLNSE